MAKERIFMRDEIGGTVESFSNLIHLTFYINFILQLKLLKYFSLFF